MIDRIVNLSNILGNYSSSFLLGARSTGKSVISREFMKNRRGVSLELLKGEVFQRYLLHPEQLRKEVSAALGEDCLTVYIDEIQKIPKLIDEVHQLLTEHPRRVRFLLTGSSARKLKRDGGNMLAGRAYTTYLYPFTHRELDRPIEETLRYGSLPGIIMDENPQLALRAYYDTYLKEEIIAEAVTRRLDTFTRFLDLAAQYDGKIVNFSELARSIGSSPNTVSSYFEILEQTLVSTRLSGWSHSVRKQLVQAPKFYFLDCGVLNAIRGELTLEVNPANRRFGELFENYVVNEFFRLNTYYQKDFRFFYWRTKEGQEIDLLCSHSRFQDPIAVEIKSKDRPQEQDVKHFQVFHQDYPKAKKYCLCTSPHAYHIGDVEVLPWQMGIQKILDL